MDKREELEQGQTEWRTFPVSSMLCLSLEAKPVINRLCKAPPIIMNGTKARTSKVNCQENTKLIMIPVPSDAKFWKRSPIRIPVAPCTADASVAKRVHKAPVLFFGSSKKAISCRRVARNVFERSRLVKASPEQPKRKLCRREKKRVSDVRPQSQMIAYLKKGRGEHEDSEANEQKDVEKHTSLLHFFITFLENLWKGRDSYSERNAQRISGNTYCGQFTQDNTKCRLDTSVANTWDTSNEDEQQLRSIHLEHCQCGIRFFRLEEYDFFGEHFFRFSPYFLLLHIVCCIITLIVTCFTSILLSVQCCHNRGC